MPLTGWNPYFCTMTKSGTWHLQHNVRQCITCSQCMHIIVCGVCECVCAFDWFVLLFHSSLTSVSHEFHMCGTNNCAGVCVTSLYVGMCAGISGGFVFIGVFVYMFVVVLGCFSFMIHDRLYSPLSWADSLRSHVILHEWIAFYSAFFEYPPKWYILTALAWLVPQETAAISARSVYIIQPCTMSLHAKPHT